MSLKNFKDGVLLFVKVKPNSAKFSIKRNHQIIIQCKSPPERNKANIEIKKKLQKIFKKEVEIIYGSKSNDKAILIHNISEEEVISKL